MRTKETECKTGHLRHGFIHCRSTDERVKKSISRSVKKAHATKKMPAVSLADFGWKTK